MLINCPDRDTEVSDRASACPRCARPIAVPILLDQPAPVTKERTDRKTWLVLAALAAAWVGMWVAIIVHSNAKPVPAAANEVENRSTKQNAFFNLCRKMGVLVHEAAIRRDAGYTEAEVAAMIEREIWDPRSLMVARTDVHGVFIAPESLSPDQIQATAISACKAQWKNSGSAE